MSRNLFGIFFTMTWIYYFGLFLLVCGTFGYSWDKSHFDDNDEMEDVLQGSMNEPVFLNDNVQKRKKREVVFETIDQVLAYLIKEVDTLRDKASLLEKDNANFQQTIATVVKITDKKLSKYSCGCLKRMLNSDGHVPCEMTTVITTMPTESTPPLAIPTLSSSYFPESVQYLDNPVEKRLDPSIIAVSYYGSYFYRYIFENKTVDTMVHERRKTYAVTFDTVEEKVIWSSYNPSVIYSSKIDGTNFTALQRDILSYGLAVDPDKRLLFMTTVSPRRAVAVMYTDGSGYRVIAHAGRYGRPSRITLDVKNELAFVSFRSRILKVAYNGSSVSVLLRGKYITCLAYDNSNAVLYYADRIVINKVKDTTEDKPKPQRVMRFKPKTGSYPSDLYVSGDNMYIGFKFKKTLEVMSMSDKTLSTLATLDGDFVSLCIVA